MTIPGWQQVRSRQLCFIAMLDGTVKDCLVSPKLLGGENRQLIAVACSYYTVQSTDTLWPLAGSFFCLHHSQTLKAASSQHNQGGACSCGLGRSQPWQAGAAVRGLRSMPRGMTHDKGPGTLYSFTEFKCTYSISYTPYQVYAGPYSVPGICWAAWNPAARSQELTPTSGTHFYY